MTLVARILDFASAVANDIKSKQDTLSSTVNIKSINNKDIVGEGNLTILGSRTFVFGGNGISSPGVNMLPISTTNFYGVFTDWRLSVKNAPVNSEFEIRFYSSNNINLTDRSLILTAILPNNVKTISGNISTIISKNTYLTIDIVLVNQASDWKLEIRQNELLEP